MLTTCDTVGHMAKMIQIRHVPDDVHRALKARAARAGMTLSDFLLAETRRLVATPDLEEFVERISRREPTGLGDATTRAVRAARDEADR